ncbi:tryptophan--tRNA ligase [Acetivibrio mesophilus]|uniref:tryptophan--tRNA ligase n=1 Tax=Acetivibrio mesophilus TaxID=2487273 RepID=UPI000840F2C3|nr:tryptophan--tRNA ligase [Acetivibrio mesophilus]ODM25466.1 tryptophan--tRNA ligase [Clostridium sp. Bc-iso-3]
MTRFIIRESEVLVKKGTILSGMRPTGALHLGNYFGALENWVKLQDDYDCYFFVADWHALTTGYEDTSEIKNNINDLVIDWISAGLDPEKCVIFLQSSIKEHAELHLLFSMTTPLSWLLRCPTYKDQLNQLKDKNITTYGFLGYPCLQAADILIYKAGFVPVGEDQLPHLELTREIARRFNYLFDEVFPEPQAILTKAKVLPGTDGRKMSKSYGNTIALSDSPDEVRKKVSTMITDPARIKKDDPGHPEVCTVFSFHKVFNEAEVPEVEEQCRGGKIGCVQCKKNLANKMVEHLGPIYERRQKILENPGMVKEIIANGNEKARKIAQQTMEDVRKAMRIDFI